MHNDHLDALRHSVQRMEQPGPAPDRGQWVVIAVVPLTRSGPVATPMLGGATRFSMRRFATAEEAVANSVAMPAARSFGGWALNITTGETVRINPFHSGRVP